MTAFLGATRTAYDIFAADYAEHFSGELPDRPFDRAMLSSFAELVQAAGDGPVADVGCGPGHVTAHLHAMGLDTFGIDLSPGMISAAQQGNPGLRFEVGTMTELDLPDGSLGGVLSMYSIIHIPAEFLSGVFAEFHRVLAPGGLVLAAFLVGDEPRHRVEAFGHEISLDYYLRQPEPVADLLVEAGFTMVAQTRREPDATEITPRAYLLARKPAPSGGVDAQVHAPGRSANDPSRSATILHQPTDRHGPTNRRGPIDRPGPTDQHEPTQGRERGSDA